MRLTTHINLIGSGKLGMNSSDSYDCNVYVLNGGSELALIDCGSGNGMSVARMLEELERDGLCPSRIRTIFLTHAHTDHAGGAADWTAALRISGGAIVAASAATADIVEQGDELANGLAAARDAGAYPAAYTFKPCPVGLRLGDRQQVRVGELTLEALATPGHSADMFSYYCPELGALFCGDTVFADGRIAALNTPDYDDAALARSLGQLSTLEVSGLFAGHLHPLLNDGREPIAAAAALYAQGLRPASIV